MIKHNKGDSWGLAGFDKALTDEDIKFVKESVKVLDSKEITWSLAPGKDRLNSFMSLTHI